MVFDRINKEIFEDTFNECYSEMLKNPYEIDVKEHYAKIIHTYSMNIMKRYPQFLMTIHNSDDWKWNEALDSGQYYNSRQVDDAFLIISTLTNNFAKEFLQSISFKKLDVENKEKWNGYHRALNENQRLKNKIEELEKQIK